MRIALALVATTFLPGIPLAAVLLRFPRDAVGWIAVAGVMGMLFSVLSTLGLTMLHLPLVALGLLTVSAAPAVAVTLFPPLRHRARETLRGLVVRPVDVFVVAVSTVMLTVPLLTVQQGLPTGDIQKAIFWGERILKQHRLPNYAEALAFNRDPTDFSTPGLHTLTAAVMAISGADIRGPGWFALLAALLLAGMAAAFAGLLRPPTAVLSFPILAFVFASAHPRFLRYVAAPGYHYQNLIGELFLLLSFFFLLRAVGGRGGERSGLLAVVSAAVLPMVHQFTAFLALTVLPILFSILLFRYRAEIASLVGRLTAVRRRVLLLLTLALGTAALFAVTLGPLGKKIFHVFNATPHLRPYVVAFPDIPELLGVPFVLLGLAGILICIVQLRRHEIEWRWALLLVWTALFLMLSQGARFFVDIPSARTLFYLVIPLSLFAALGTASAVERVRLLWPRLNAAWMTIALALTLAPTVGNSLNESLQNIDHALQANATLTPATLDLLEFLQSNPPRCAMEEPTGTPAQTDTFCSDGILVDDWNRRRATWAMLSPFRMLTRVGADIAVIAREARQSEQRRAQYETLLDFEKIFSLGNSPAILPLLQRHRIAYVVSANDLSDDIFTRNPILEPVYRNAEVTVFATASGVTTPTASPLLLARTTLANDVGDAEDVFAHQPLSLLAPQISAPITEGARTFRDVNSAVSTIGLNAGTYLPNLWDTDSDRAIRSPIALTLQVMGNGARGRIARGTKVYAEFAVPADGTPHVIQAHIPGYQLPLSAKGIAPVTLRLDRGPLRVDLVSATLLGGFPEL